MDFYTIKDAQADLAIAPLNLTVLLAPYTVTPALTLESAIDGSLEIPAGYKSVGHFQKQAGLTLGNEFDSKDIEAYGEPEPIRTIINKRTTTFDFSMYQNQRNVLELIWTQDFSDVEPSEFGGIVLEAPKVPKNIYYRAILVGLDDRNDREVWVYWLMPKVKLDRLDNQTLNDDNVIEYKPTLKAFRDDTVGYSVAQGFAGPGWRDIVATAGFGRALTALTITPNAPSVTVASGASHTAQLLVEGDNGINYTPDCTFVSSDPTKATVSTSGLVTGIAAGSTTITAKKGALEATATVTVTA
ncbi:major tail protein [Mycobacterium phage Crossroads]|uniref:Major tail protein n=2 Tax=Faithunavirus TaxID=2948705 RepID=F6M808_9CAUD|nr:major tail protein [Mycobacterium phage Faith1]YP_008410888.1 major tail protein [Mycobacterium phage Crossroads]YP_009017238.1 major tail protein [Mycobacterium phage Rumpelstiltskin]AGK87576.1 major tail protein [Mycobacterium phage Winky]AGM12622.1 major tail protein [Mycobacterium phage Breezona]AOT22872.1 major tail protein [Mycobacterium phage Zakai]ASM62619.1 major tail protein [Mycobacterium phage Miley16]AYN57060.1 major tail protein [Mycobacterium phage BigCheese]QGJ93887.1 maj